jgi:predicted Fe-Mo cluster-binding NifX family protein
MRVAIPTNDKEYIFKRSGRTKGFLILDILPEGVKTIDYRINSHSHHHHHHGEHEHEHGHSHKEIVDKLKDCNYLIVNIIGSHFEHDIKDAGIKIFKTDKKLISEAVDEFKAKNDY